MMWIMICDIVVTISSIMWVGEIFLIFFNCGLAYSARHMAIEDRNQSREGRGVGAQEHQVPMPTKGGIFAIL